MTPILAARDVIVGFVLIQDDVWVLMSLPDDQLYLYDGDDDDGGDDGELDVVDVDENIATKTKGTTRRRSFFIMNRQHTS